MRQETAEKIKVLEQYKADIQAHYQGDHTVRSRISRCTPRVKAILDEAGAMKVITLTPPPALGGLIVRNADPFGFILQDYYGMTTIPMVSDMIDEGIGILESPESKRNYRVVRRAAHNRSRSQVGAHRKRRKRRYRTK